MVKKKIRNLSILSISKNLEQRKQYLSLLELLIGTIIWKSIYLYLQFFYPVYSKHTNMKLKDL